MLTLPEAHIWSGLDDAVFCRRLSGVASNEERAAELRIPARFASESVCRQELCSPRPPRYLGHAALRELFAPQARKTVTIGIQKGGVGKTVIALNLSVALAMLGVRTLLVDCDPQASGTNFMLPDDVAYENLPTTLEVCCESHVTFGRAVTPTRYAGLDLVASKPSVRKADALLRGEGTHRFLKDKMADVPHDCVIFDVPPGFGDLVRGAYLLSDEVVMPVLPDAWSIESAALTKADIEDAAREVGIAPPRMRLLRNRFRPGRIASDDALSVLQENGQEEILPVSLPETAGVQNCVNDGQSLLENGGPVLRKAFLDLAALLWKGELRA